jgi:hypothetical protein
MPNTPAFLKRDRLAYVGSHSFVLLIGFVALCSGVTFWADPNAPQYAATNLLDPPIFQYIWSSLFLIGGILICYGLIALSLRIEAAGHTSIATAILMEALMLVSHLDYSTLTAWITILTLIATFIAIMFRLWALFEAINIADSKLLLIARRRIQSYDGHE